MQVGDQVVANNKDYWGKYHETTVEIVRKMGPTIFEVETYDGKLYTASESMLQSADEFYLEEFERMLDLPDLPKECWCGKDKHKFAGKHLDWCPKGGI